MKAIYKKELRSYFSSVTAFLFIAATLFLVGLYFVSYNVFGGYPNLSYALSSGSILFLISIPVLTMRILSEERRQKTDQLILTAPVSVGKIVLGKFFALATIYAIPILIFAVFPLVLSLFGTVSILESYMALLGFFLYGLACIAVGIFVSSVTESQVIASVLTFLILFMSFVMTGICNLISQTGNVLTKLLSLFNMSSRFEQFLTGTLEIGAVLYFITGIGFLLFLTAQSIQKRRYSLSVKNLKFSAFSTGMIAVVLCIVFGVNLLAAQLPAKYASIDLTANRLFSITGKTENFLAGLNDDVTIYVLNAENSADTMVASTLERYADASGHVKVEYVDPNINPKFHTQYTDDPALTMNSLIVVSEKRNRVIPYSQLYEQEVDYTTYSATTTGYDAEGQITSAIAYVTGDNMPKLYMIEGHGEAEMEASFQQTIEKQNMEYESINLMQYDAVPEDADAILLNAPSRDLSKEDADKLLAYLKNGGKALVTSNWTGEEMPYYDQILSYFQVELEDGVVIESDRNYYYQNQMYLLPEIVPSTITQNLQDGSLVFAPLVQGIRYTDTEEDSVATEELLTTSEKSFARADLQNETSLSMGENDKPGPFAAGLHVTKTEGEQESELIFFSSANLFTQSADQMVSGANVTLFSGALTALGEYENSISIPVKSYEAGNLMIPEANIMVISLVTVVILPLILIAAGILIWYGRRKR